MKRISTLLSLGVLVALSATLVSNSNGVAHQQNKDRTGAPGSDATCKQCHAGGSYAPTVEVDLAISDMVGVPEYTPGATHTIWITVAGSGNPAGFGVHGTAVLENGANAGSFTDQASDDCIYLDQVEGRHIFEQNDLCEDGFFMVEWTAPPAGSGPMEKRRALCQGPWTRQAPGVVNHPSAPVAAAATAFHAQEADSEHRRVMVKENRRRPHNRENLGQSSNDDEP